MKGSETILQAIKAAVQEKEPGAEIVLFGSRARGDEREDSDWDVLIICERDVTWAFKKEIRDSLFYVGLNFDATISSLLVNKKDWDVRLKNFPIHTEVEREGVLL